jgi:hypothetical protein
MSLPTFKDPNTNLMLMQSSWSSQLNPVLGNPITNPTLLANVALKTGTNVINHKLGTTPIGWFITDLNAPVMVYRSAAFNPLTLTLTASGACIISLAVF